MIQSNSLENKASLTKEIRGKLEDVVKTGNVIFHIENLTGEKLLLEHLKIETGIYKITLLDEDDYIDILDRPLQLEKLKLSISVRV
jgi:hypothetical protein